jgi:hypothetical protein
LLDGGFAIVYVNGYDGDYSLQLYDSSGNSVGVKRSLALYTGETFCIYGLSDGRFVVTLSFSSSLKLIYCDKTGNMIKTNAIAVPIASPYYSKVFDYDLNGRSILIFSYVDSNLLYAKYQIFEVDGTPVGALTDLSSWSGARTATTALDIIKLKNGLYAIGWADTINGGVDVISPDGGVYNSSTFTIMTLDVKPRVANLSNNGLAVVYGADQARGFLIEYKGTCVDFSNTFGRTEMNKIAFPSFTPISSYVIITKLTQYGALYNDLMKGDADKSYPTDKVKFQSTDLIGKKDTFFYKVDPDDIPCKFTLIPCFSTCKTCEDVGDDESNHKCTSCLISEGYYPLADNPYNCYILNSKLKGYLYSSDNKRFDKCYSSCKSCSATGVYENNNCIECDLSQGYYPLQNVPQQCYYSSTNVEGYYTDDTLQRFSLCFFACKTCSKGGGRKNPNCLNCKKNEDCNPCNKLIYEDICYDKCPDGTYEKDNTCIKCSPSNPLCCSKIFYQNECIDNCIEPTVYSTTSKTCYSCDSVGLLYSGGLCQEKCNKGDGNVNGVCTNCFSKGKYYYDGECLSNCLDGTFPMNDNICENRPVMEIAHCTSDYCQNGGTCIVAFNQLDCNCVDTYIGEHCQYVKSGFDFNSFIGMFVL